MKLHPPEALTVMYSRFRVLRSSALWLGALLFLAACSGKDNLVEPVDLPDIEAEYKVKRYWKREVGKGLDEEFIKLYPAVTERTVFAADVHGLVRAYERESGRKRWKVKTGLRISSGLYAGYGRVLLATRDGEAVALSSEDGSVLWNKPLTSEALSVPTSDGVRAFFQSMDGRVTALDLETGEEVWSFDVTVPVLSLRGSASPLVQEGVLYAAFASGKIVALDARNGVPVWERRLAEPSGRSELERIIDIDGNLIVQGGGVFSATYQGKVGVLDQETGRPYWGREMSVYTPVAADVSHLFVIDEDSRIYALDPRSGGIRWKQEKLLGRRLNGALMHGDYLLVGDYKGYLHWLDPVDGHFVARRRHAWEDFAGVPVVYGDVLYVLSEDGKLCAYWLKTKAGSFWTRLFK